MTKWVAPHGYLGLRHAFEHPVDHTGVFHTISSARQGFLMNLRYSIPIRSSSGAYVHSKMLKDSFEIGR